MEISGCAITPILIFMIHGFVLGVTTAILRFYHHFQSTRDSAILKESTYIEWPMLVTSNSFTSATSMKFTILNPDSK